MTTKIPRYFSLSDHYSCVFTQWREITDSIDYSNFHTGPKKASVEEDPAHTVTQQNLFQSEKGNKAPLQGIYSVKQIISLHEGAKTGKWVALSPSICMPSLSLYLSEHRSVTEWDQAAFPWSTFTRGQFKQPKSLCRRKGLNKSTGMQGNTLLPQCSCCVRQRH